MLINIRIVPQTPRLWTLDPLALNHVLTHESDYARPEVNLRDLANTLGKGTNGGASRDMPTAHLHLMYHVGILFVRGTSFL